MLRAAALIALVAGFQESESLKVERYDLSGLGARFQDHPRDADPAALPRAIESLVRTLFPGRALDLSDDELSVRATADEHRRLRAIVDDVKSGKGRMVRATARLVSTRSDVFDGKRKVKPSSASLPAADAEAAIRKADDLQSLTAPRLTTFNGQRSEIVVARQIAYVQGYETTMSADGEAAVNDPVVGIALAGIIVRTRSILVDPDKSDVFLGEMTLELAQPTEEKFRQIKTPQGTIEDPQLVRAVYRLDPRIVREGQTVIAGPFARPGVESGSPPLWLLVDFSAQKP